MESAEPHSINITHSINIIYNLKFNIGFRGIIYKSNVWLMLGWADSRFYQWVFMIK